MLHVPHAVTVVGAVLTAFALFFLSPAALSRQPYLGSLEAKRGETSFRPQVPPSAPAEARYNLSDIWFPQHASEDQPWVEHNTGAFRELLSCMQRGDCKKNQDKVVIIGSWFIRDSLLPTKFAGEHVWGRSLLKALGNLGYTYVFATDNLDIARVHKMFPSLVVAIFFEPYDLDSCVRDEAHCLKSPQNPYGIPIWKLLMFYFWADPKGPLGEQWTVSPEPYHRLSRRYPHNRYIGYTVEDSCKTHSPIPHSERDNRAYFMSKKAQWFVNSWPREFYDAAMEELDLYFVMGLHERSATVPDYPDIPLAEEYIPFPEDVVDLGALRPSEFLSELSRSKMVIGLGAPVTSPTPYEALCLGVPFINPIKEWDHRHPEDRYSWVTQHDTLRFMDPPYVYNVFVGDKEGFVEAVKSALETPAPPYVLHDMRLPEIEKRVAALLERDHYALAKDILDRRTAGLEDGPMFML